MATIMDKPDLEIRLPARADNVALLRHLFGGLGVALGVDEQALDDIRLAVTEACTNVVLHAYSEGEQGPLEVQAAVNGAHLTVVVRDFGPGIGPRPQSAGRGLGLSLIAMVAESVEMAEDSAGSNEVRMVFSLDGGGG